MKIRQAEKKDLKEIIKLNQFLFEYDSKFDNTLDMNWPSKNKKYFEKSISGDNSFVLVAVKDSKIVGYFIGTITSAEDYRKIKKIAEMDNMFILKEYRNSNIGSIFVKKFLDWAKSRNISRSKVVVSSENLRAINFYKKNKFKGYSLVLENKLK